MKVRFANANVYNTFLHAFIPCDVVVKDGRFLYAFLDDTPKEADETVDMKGRYILPSFVDIHLHVESSMVTPAVFSPMLLRAGVTACVAEPHEIANVFGKEGVEKFLEQGRTCQADIFCGVPSSVPCSENETTGGRVELDDALSLIENNKEVACLGEVMNCVSVLNEPDGKIRTWLKTLRERYPALPREGHIAYYTGKELCEIAFHGVDSDHTSAGLLCFTERLKQGVFVELQEKTLLPEVVRYIEDNDVWDGFSLVTDDVMPDKLMDRGHLDVVLRKAVALGMKLERAIRAVTYNPAQRMRFFDRGAIAPGYLADFVVIDDLSAPRVLKTYMRGQCVYGCEKPLAFPAPAHFFPDRFYDSVRLPRLNEKDFSAPAPLGVQEALCRLIVVSHDTTRTREERVTVPVSNGALRFEKAGVCLLAVFDRYSGRAGRAYGLVGGEDFISRGAIACTYAHDHHNLLVCGASRADMALAANTVIDAHGGYCVAQDGKVLAFLPLPVGGIVTEAPMPQVADAARKLTASMEALGYRHPNPLMSFSCLSLSVSPALRLTDKGLIDVKRGVIVPLILEKGET